MHERSSRSKIFHLCFFFPLCLNLNVSITTDLEFHAVRTNLPEYLSKYLDPELPENKIQGGLS